jgi:hypothetical protein
MHTSNTLIILSASLKKHCIFMSSMRAACPANLYLFATSLFLAMAVYHFLHTLLWGLFPL